MSSNARKAAKSVASAANATVEGYLRNISRRQRIPAAEGGRGTRRKMAMVTSSSVHTLPEKTGSVAEEDSCNMVAELDEWDEVVLPVALVSVKKLEEGENFSTVKTNVTEDGDGLMVKHDPACSPATMKSEATSPTSNDRVDVGSCHVKAEVVNIDDIEAAHDQYIMEGSQLSLVGQPHASNTWRQSDPAYEAMREQKDLLAAKRRSERIQRVCESVFALLAAFIRARLFWRESCHRRFVQGLLRLHVQRERGLKHARFETPPARATGAYVFINAVAAAKVLVAESSKTLYRRPSLAPAWVTCAKDAIQNKTSAAVRVILEAINNHFNLEAPAPPVSSGLQEEASEQDFSDWSFPITPRFLFKKMAACRWCLSPDTPVSLPHPLYFSLIFLALARLAGLSCRLVVAKMTTTALEKARAVTCVDDSSNIDMTSSERREHVAEDKGRRNTRQSLPTLSIFEGRNKRKTSDLTAASGAVAAGQGSKRPRSSAGSVQGPSDIEGFKSKKLPTSCYWVEVWSAECESFFSVNPCKSCATLWGAPYTLSVSGHVAMDVTPRYISRYSSAYTYGRRLGTLQQNRFLWHDKISWDDSRELSEVLRATFNVEALHTSALTQRQQQRESRQLHSLMYSESVPTTLNALHRHPLYVIDTDLARHEGVYPKDANTTVGSVKGHLVYKRSAIVSLRSRDGWLREGRSLLTEDQPPYKVVKPPASRPFGTPSAFYGRWQTKPFEPLPLNAGDPPSIPHHGKTSWYILLDKAPPPGILHMTQPQISRVARRMRLDFGLAVVGFQRRRTDEHRRGHWETIISGIVVKETDCAALLHAYDEWVQLVEEQEALKRRQRAFHWWLLLAQRLLALKRLQDQYAKGLDAGAMPTQ